MQNEGPVTTNQSNTSSQRLMFSSQQQSNCSTAAEYLTETQTFTGPREGLLQEVAKDAIPENL